MSTEEVLSDDSGALPPRKDMAAPLTEWGPWKRFKLMDQRDCPHNYITAFQQPFELHTCSLQRHTAALHSYHSCKQECAVTDIALCGTLGQGYAPWELKPPRLFAYRVFGLKTEGGLEKTKDQT